MANYVTITGIRQGTTTITATYTDGGVTKTASVENFQVTAIAATLTFTSSHGPITYDGTRKAIGTVNYGGDGSAYYLVIKATSQPSTPSASSTEGTGWIPVSDGGIVYATNAAPSDAGTYYVFLRSTAGNNYVGEDPKQGGNKTIDKRTVSVTGEPTTVSNALTYDGTSKTLVSNTASSTDNAGTFYYYVSTSSTAPSWGDSGWTTTLPTGTDAGEYYIWYYCQVDTANNNAGTNTNSVKSLSGSPKEIARATSATASALSNVVYNGTTETNGTAQSGVSGSYVTWSGNTTGTNAGSYTAYATPDSNHAWSDGTYAQRTVTWSIARRGQTAPVLNGDSKEYHNTASASIKTAGTVADGVATAPGTLVWENRERTAVGTQTATAYYAATANNFSASPVSEGVTVEVTKATDASVSVTLATGTLTYNGTTNSNGSAQTLATATSHGCTYYLIAHNSPTSAPASDAAGWTNGSVSATNAGTYYIWYKGTADSNHSNDVAITYEGPVVIERAKTASAISISELVYNGTTENNGTSQVGVSGQHVTWSGTQSAVNAGSYSATATPESNFAWSDGTYAAMPVSWSIARRGQTAPVLQGAETTYPTRAEASVRTRGIVEGGESTDYAPGELVWTDQIRTTAGIQTATAYYAATTTNFSASPVSEGVTVKVNAQAVTVTAPTLVAGDLVYDGTAQTIVNAGSSTTGGTMYYYVSESSTEPTFNTSTWTTTTPIERTDAGTYYVWYYCQVTDTSNYSGSGINTVTPVSGNSKTIAQKEVSLNWSEHTFTYDGTQKTVTCTLGGVVSGDNCSVTVSNNTRTNAGSQTVSVTGLVGTSSDNYKLPATTTTTLTINKANLDVTEVTYNGIWDGVVHSGYIVVDNDDWDGKTVVMGSTQTYGTTVTTNGAPDQNIVLISSSSYTPQATIYYKVTGGDNYNDYEDSIQFAIGKEAATLPGTITGDSANVAYHNIARATVSTDYTGGTLQYATSADNNTWSSWSDVTWESGNLTANPSRTDIGTTYVKFKVAGDSNHNDSDESNVVTLTVYAASDANMVVDIVSSTLTYNGTSCGNGTAQTIASVDTANESKYHGVGSYSIGYRKDATATADNQITWVNTTPLTVTDAGTYHIYYKFEPDSNHSNGKPWTSHADNYVGSVTINPKAGSLSASTVDRTYNGTSGNNGTAQELAQNTVATGTYYFGIGSSSTVAPSTWGSANALPTGTDAGTYHIWAKCDASSNGNCAAVNATYIGAAVISQKASTVTYSVNTSIDEFCTESAVPASTWSRNDALEIATSSASGTGTGTITYTISQDGWTISSDGKTITIPNTATAGTYSVTVTASQAANGNWSAGSASQTISVTLKANALESITLTLAANTIAFNDTTTGTVMAIYTNGSSKDVTSTADYSSNPTGIVTITK